MPSRFSFRVSTQRSGRPVCLAAQATMIVSRSVAILAPKPPPTSGAMTRTAGASSPTAAASASRASCAFWVLAHSVSRPSAQRAAAARPSSGSGASRWLGNVRRTTTSQPSNAPGGAGSPPERITLESVPSNSSVPPASASSKSTTAGSGS